jgi:hypothetical protein
MGRIYRNPERYADRVEFAYVDDAAHFITDDALAAVADLSRSTGSNEQHDVWLAHYSDVRPRPAIVGPVCGPPGICWSMAARGGLRLVPTVGDQHRHRRAGPGRSRWS